SYVLPQTSTPPGGARDCSRKAMFTTSPATLACPPSRAAARSTMASPVATPSRNRSPPACSGANRASTRCSSSPARTHRSGSVSVATGAPNSAITASPMYFSTTPPYCAMTRRVAEKKLVCTRRNSSGSVRSAYGVESTRSTKSTLTRRRSSSAAVARCSPSRGAPQPVQKAASGANGRPQPGQARLSSAPQPPQNRSSAAAARPQREQGAGMGSSWRCGRVGATGRVVASSRRCEGPCVRVSPRCRMSGIRLLARGQCARPHPATVGADLTGEQEARMVYVRLAKEWTDGDGTTHSAGDMVDVDAATLAELEASGIVEGSGGKTQAWPGPTGGDTDAWPGPTV